VGVGVMGGGGGAGLQEGGDKEDGARKKNVSSEGGGSGGRADGVGGGGDKAGDVGGEEDLRQTILFLALVCVVGLAMFVIFVAISRLSKRVLSGGGWGRSRTGTQDVGTSMRIDPVSPMSGEGGWGWAE
jgi:hypothetical protein